MNVGRALAVLPLWLAVAVGTACSSGPSYEESAELCAQALRERPEEKTGKPEACEVLTEDDYTAIALYVELQRRGWHDENGEIDWGQVLKDAGTPSG